LRLARAAKARVLGRGSGGVDLDRFTPLRRSSSQTEALRQGLGLTHQETIIGFVGRLVKDKGIRELVEAFRDLSAAIPNLRLLLVGDFEAGDPVGQEVQKQIESAATILRTGFVQHPAPYYALMDVFVLPTHREGFSGAALEAQASGVPLITTNATGAVDSVKDGITGSVVPVGDTKALGAAIETLLRNPDLRTRMGRAARQWMEQNFGAETVWSAHAEFYREMIVERSRSRAGRSLAFKRALDLVGATAALALFAPLLALIALFVRVFLGSPVLFRQIRPGYKGHPFTCLKFRTMSDKRDEKGRLLPDAERITALGRFLRRASLDELPELINVILGEMSLVGPRPLLMEYLDRYTPEQMRRHDVPPGITGWAQIHGRNAASWEQKFAFDLWYVEHRTWFLDFKILLATIWKTLMQDGISQPGRVTAEEFMGYSKTEIRGEAR
jgi:lipopolysaccharide/colanic/teichoic acid biosynthesis glycosyltransferase